MKVRAPLVSLIAFVLMAASLRAEDKSPSAKYEKDIQAYEAADKKSPPLQMNIDGFEISPIL